MAASRRRKRPAGEGERKQQRSAAVRFIDRIGRTETVVFGLTIGVGVWAWMTYVVVPASQQNVAAFGYTFVAVSCAGALVQTVMLCYVRRPGSWRERLAAPMVRRLKGAGVVYWAPPILFGLVFLAVTPPSTPAKAFEYGWNIYQAIALMVLLCALFTVLGALVVFGCIVVPLALLLATLLPEGHAADGRSSDPLPISRSEAVLFCLIIASAIGFGISMSAITDTGAEGKHAAMADQLIALITFRGGTTATILAYVSIAALIVLVALARRARR